MRVLFIGDIVAEPGRKVVKEILPELKKTQNLDCVIANAENSAGGRGFTYEIIKELQYAGVDFFTGGDHLFWQKGSEDYIDELPIVRPANYPEAPGIGHKVLDLGAKGKLLIINLLGRTFLNEKLDNPFTKADEILELYVDNKVSATLIDFHAEATSEKYSLGFYLDGRVDMIAGTHTHVPTADATVLPKGTLYISDVGMTGIIDSVLGVKKEIILSLYLTGMNQKFVWEDTGRKAFRSVLFDTEAKTVSRLDFYV